MILRSLTIIISFLFLLIHSTYAVDDWCITDSENLPCKGAPGRCTVNYDASLGGFVADSATVESVLVGGLTHNGPHIGLHASICDHAHVIGHAHVTDYAQITEKAWVAENAWIADHAQVTGNAQVYGNAWVFENAQVTGDAWVYANARVFGSAWVYGDTYVGGDAKIFRNVVISTGDYGF